MFTGARYKLQAGRSRVRVLMGSSMSLLSRKCAILDMSEAL
jgi:hypothetical protein